MGVVMARGFGWCPCSWSICLVGGNALRGERWVLEATSAQQGDEFCRNQGTCLKGRLTMRRVSQRDLNTCQSLFLKAGFLGRCFSGVSYNLRLSQAGRDSQGSAIPFSSQEYPELKRGLRALFRCSLSSGRLCHDHLFPWRTHSRDQPLYGGRTFPNVPPELSLRQLHSISSFGII